MKYVYLMQIEGMDIYKIGHSKNPNQRLETVQTGNPFKVILVDSYKTKRATQVEAAMHNRYTSHKVNEDEMKLMGEWFQLDNETRKNFKEICQKLDSNFEIIESMSTLYDKDASKKQTKKPK
jgi:hypothetical protein